jgi:DNA-binding XRE family transcriptional regulator
VTGPERHSRWSRAHRRRCRGCREDYNAYERGRRPSKGLFAQPGYRTPESVQARRDWLLDIGAGEIREACGISQRTMAAALGVSQATVCFWETGRSAPRSPAGAAYCRVIAGLLRHLAAGLEEDQAAAPEGRRAA